MNRRGPASDRADVLRLRALAAGADLELDPLALFEGLETLALDRREVHEHVVATLTRDESETLVGIEELHSALHLFAHFVREPITHVVGTPQRSEDASVAWGRSSTSG